MKNQKKNNNAKATLGVSSLNDANLESKGTFILTSMTNNPDYPSPTPSLADVATAIKNFGDAIVGSKTRDAVKVAAKKEMRIALIAVLTDLCRYVNFAAQGDRTKLIGSGFNVSAESRSARVLGTIENFTVTPGLHSGEAILNLKTVKGANTYVFLYAQQGAANDTWSVAITSYSSITLSNLEPLKTYNFRVAVSGSNDQTKFSNIIVKAVL